ncbi:hypothetical protein ES702_00731 [subsurface metagenome]
MQKCLLKLEDLFLLYPEVTRTQIKLKWSNSHLVRLYKDGYKYCSLCKYLIKLNIDFCRNCGKMFRCRPRSKSNMYDLVTESIYKPQTIRLRSLKK